MLANLESRLLDHVSKRTARNRLWRLRPLLDDPTDSLKERRGATFKTSTARADLRRVIAQQENIVHAKA